ncbi:MAG: hypothetical protein ACPLKP_01705 [Microgenomates group bacterium]
MNRAERLLNIVPPLVAGVIREYPSELEELISPLPNYEKYGKRIFYNPEPENFLEELLREIKNLKIPLGELKFRKREIFAYFTAFADQHNGKLPEEFFSPKAVSLIKVIIEVSKNLRRPLTLREQLKESLMVSSDLLEAIIILATGCRVAARNYETRMGLVISKEEMEEWKTCVAPFGYNNKVLNDPAGDTYHFWHAVLAGVSVRLKREKNFYERISGFILEEIYRRTALFTEILRHRLAKHNGQPHDTIDVLGLEIGQALGILLLDNNDGGENIAIGD